MNKKNQDNSSSASYEALVDKRIKEKAERETRDQEYRLKSGDIRLSEQWFIRYPLSCLLLAFAFFSYKMWLEGVRVQGILHIFVNPIMPAILTLIALANTWELTLAAVIISMLYLSFIGIAALPLSIAVIVGSLIIAYALVIKKKWR
jgi:hypothetical protein